MKKETENWLNYSEENLQAAKILLRSELYNACLQNVQQTVEKALKSLFIEKSLPFKKTHNIFELKNILERNNILVDISDDECDFLDSIYLPSKYPAFGVLPYFYPDKETCQKAILTAEKVLTDVKNLMRDK